MKTSEMIGAQLDWAVAKCEGFGTNYGNQMDIRKDINGKVSCLLAPINREYVMWNPTRNWAQGGPIIEREGLYLRANDTNTKWACGALSINTRDKSPGPLYWADTPLVAAMRCYVASKLGDEVEIPEDLK